MGINENLNKFELPSTFNYDVDECDAKVIAIFNKNFEAIDESIANNENWIVLDTTCMYALSGGEEPDKGWLLFNNNKYEVVDVIKAPNGQHLHCIKQGGLKVGDSVKVVCDKLMKQIISANHTAEHIVQGALKHILDPNIKQMGVNLKHDLLSVSFAYDKKLDNNQLKQIEDYVNKAIKDSINVEVYFKTLEEAVKMGAIARFSEVYSKVKGLLRIVKIDNIYTVLCAGRHVHNTNELEQFHIVRFASKGSNVYKIDGISTNYLTNVYINKYKEEIKSVVSKIENAILENNFKDENITNRLNSIVKSDSWDKTIENLKTVNQLLIDFNKALESFKNKQMNEVVNQIVESSNFDLSKPYHLIEIINQPSNILSMLGSKLINKYQNNGFVITNTINGKLSYLIIKNQNANIQKPNELIRIINAAVNGRGGGKENQCQGSCPLTNETINKIKELIK